MENEEANLTIEDDAGAGRRDKTDYTANDRDRKQEDKGGKPP